MAKNYPPNYNWGTGAKPHTAGIDALPKVFYRNGVAYPVGADPFSIPRGTPLTAAQMRAPIKNQIGGPVRSTDKKVREAQRDVRNASKKNSKGLTRDDLTKAAKAGKTLHADLDSTCFESLSWRNGVATGVFWHGPGDRTYEYECDIDTFLAWATDSLGEFFNAEIRD